MTQSKHTPYPFNGPLNCKSHTMLVDGTWATGIYDGYDEGVAVVYGDEDVERIDFGNSRGKAEFIVRACNAHDDLVAALEGMIHEYRMMHDDSAMMEDAAFSEYQKALAKAKAQS